VIVVEDQVDSIGQAAELVEQGGENRLHRRVRSV
jgi:hypothetical protein